MGKNVDDFSSTDALSLTSDYSTTSSAPLTMPMTVSCADHLAASSDYASSDVSPYARNASSSPYQPENDLDSAKVLFLIFCCFAYLQYLGKDL